MIAHNLNLKLSNIYHRTIWPNGHFHWPFLAAHAFACDASTCCSMHTRMESTDRVDICRAFRWYGCASGDKIWTIGEHFLSESAPVLLHLAVSMRRRLRELAVVDSDWVFADAAALSVVALLRRSLSVAVNDECGVSAEASEGLLNTFAAEQFRRDVLRKLISSTAIGSDRQIKSWKCPKYNKLLFIY